MALLKKTKMIHRKLELKVQILMIYLKPTWYLKFSPALTYLNQTYINLRTIWRWQSRLVQV